MTRNKKIIFIILLAALLIGSTATFLYLRSKSALSPKHKDAICAKYNNGLRSGSCAEGAPSYCATVYYPPSCKGCQDGSGCGYEQSEK